MSSRAQRRANRQNSKRSTGPKTPEGKLASSRNNLRHGLAGRLIVADLSPSDAAKFNVLALSLRAEHAPATPTETLLVDRMIESYWRSSRAIGLQSAALMSGDDQRLSLLLRYQTTHERAFLKSSTSSQNSEKKTANIELASNRRLANKLATKPKARRWKPASARACHAPFILSAPLRLSRSQFLNKNPFSFNSFRYLGLEFHDPILGILPRGSPTYAEINE